MLESTIKHEKPHGEVVKGTFWTFLSNTDGLVDLAVVYFRYKDRGYYQTFERYSGKENLFRQEYWTILAEPTPYVNFNGNQQRWALLEQLCKCQGPGQPCEVEAVCSSRGGVFYVPAVNW